MWLVTLFKARDNAEIGEDGVLSINSCELDDYIDTGNYEHELNLCNYWDDDAKKGMLIIKKKLEQIALHPLQNERFMIYNCTIGYGSIYAYYNIISLEYLENGIFFIDFYVFTGIYVLFNIPPEIFSAPDPNLSFLKYINGKTLNIGITNNGTPNPNPKYSIVFDDTCRYYYYNSPYDLYPTIFIVKNPFLILMFLLPHYNSVAMLIGMKPKLTEEFNDYSITQTTYDSNNDPSLKADDIVNLYFDSNTKTGIARNGVDINDDTDKFSYELIRALLGTSKNDTDQNYYFILDDNIGTIYPSENSYMSLAETPVCIYFPLFRPQLDSAGVSKTWPQYDPNDTTKYMYSFYLGINLNNNGEVEYSTLAMVYGIRLSNPTYCYDSSTGSMPSWHPTGCDLALPFRFAGDADCSTTDGWANNLINANYLFRIVKPSSTNSYNIKGIGCEELTQNISSFSDFSANSEFYNTISANGIYELQRITFSASGYPIEGMATTLDSYGVTNNETCFVLFNESLVDNATDFTSIYTEVTSALPNSIVCYIGSDAKIPSTHRNKVIHSDAIVTDLNTGETMPLVIKYIMYAKRLFNLFNG